MIFIRFIMFIIIIIKTINIIILLLIQLKNELIDEHVYDIILYY